MSVFEVAPSELRELLELVVEIDRITREISAGRFFETLSAKIKFHRKQNRALQLREKYGL